MRLQTTTEAEAREMVRQQNVAAIKRLERQLARFRQLPDFREYTWFLQDCKDQVIGDSLRRG